MRRRIFGLFLIGTLATASQAVPAIAAQKKATGNPGGGAVVITASRQDESPPLTSITPVPDGKSRAHAARKRHGQFADMAETPQDQANPAPVGASTAPSTATSWEGIHNINGVLPPDTNGDVGPNNYVQWVNLSYQVWNKTGTSIYGPVNGATLWSGFGGLCQTTNDGDPVVLYDKLANRWFLSQFAFNTDSAGNPVAPFHQCIAVSTTGDPTGSFWRYDYNVGSLMNDYPKFGVWPDG
ncbi:MAG: hypothetical protein E6G27_06070, partial [Actinobacteria bacterium]